MVEIAGGEKLRKKLLEIATQANRPAVLRVGFLENSTYPDGTPTALVAAVQEFGGGDVPARPYFRPMVAEKSPRWGDAIGKLLVANGYDAVKALSLAGEGIKGQLQASIKAVTSPPLKPATVARKGFSKPLVDTGHMLNSVAAEVKTP